MLGPYGPVKDEWCTEVVVTGRLSSVQRIIMSWFLLSLILSPMLHPPKGPAESACSKEIARNRAIKGGVRVPPLRRKSSSSPLQGR